MENHQIKTQFISRPQKFPITKVSNSVIIDKLFLGVAHEMNAMKEPSEGREQALLPDDGEIAALGAGTGRKLSVS